MTDKLKLSQSMLRLCPRFPFQKQDTKIPDFNLSMVTKIHFLLRCTYFPPSARAVPGLILWFGVDNDRKFSARGWRLIEKRTSFLISLLSMYFLFPFESWCDLKKGLKKTQNSRVRKDIKNLKIVQEREEKIILDYKFWIWKLQLS